MAQLRLYHTISKTFSTVGSCTRVCLCIQYMCKNSCQGMHVMLLNPGCLLEHLFRDAEHEHARNCHNMLFRSEQSTCCLISDDGWGCHYQTHIFLCKKDECPADGTLLVHAHAHHVRSQLLHAFQHTWVAPSTSMLQKRAKAVSSAEERLIGSICYNLCQLLMQLWRLDQSLHRLFE